MKRIDFIDILRGHFLIAIFVNHISAFLGMSIFYYYSGYGKLYVSAAEGFVFLAGFILGYIYIYKNKYKTNQLVKKLLKRTAILYLISVFLTIFYSIFFWNSSLPLSGIYEGISTYNFIEMIINSLLLRHVYGWADIILLYFYLIPLFGIPSIILMKKMKRVGPFLVVLLSLSIWFSSNIYYTDTLKVSIFNVLSWQLLLVLGILIGAKYKILASYVSKYIAKSYNLLVGIFLGLFVIIVSISEIKLFSFFDLDIYSKNNLGIGRLILFGFWMLFNATVIYLVTKTRINQIFKIYKYFGRISLTVYATQSLIVMIFLDFARYYEIYDFLGISILVSIALVVLYLSVRLVNILDKFFIYSFKSNSITN